MNGWNNMKLFVFGLGFSAQSAVKYLSPYIKGQKGWIAATSRSKEKIQEMENVGIKAHLFSGEKKGDDQLEKKLLEATHLLVSISPGQQDPVLAHYSDIIKQSKNLTWIGYYSTVGVYGDHQGAWVDETAQLYPVSKRSKERIVAEKGWRSLAYTINVPLAIFRLAGIYGPGRNAFVNLEKGKARRIIKQGQVFNRIHVSDIGLMTEKAAYLKLDGILNGVDDEPAPPQDVVEYAAIKMSKPVPEGIAFDKADLSPMGRSFYGETKRVSNKSTKQRLGIMLTYPTYKEALDTLWEDKNWQNVPPLKEIMT